LYGLSVDVYGKRMIVAVEPLCRLLAGFLSRMYRHGTSNAELCSTLQYLGRRSTYIAAKPIIPLTTTLARFFICKSFTMKMGRIPKVQSANEFSPETI
jgi:hypothetical protein